MSGSEQPTHYAPKFCTVGPSLHHEHYKDEQKKPPK